MGGGRKKKRKDKGYEKFRTKVKYVFHLTNRTYQWMGTPFMGLSINRVQHFQYSSSLYFIRFSSHRPLFQFYWPTPTPKFITPFVDYPRITGSTSICKDLWLGIIHESQQITDQLRSDGPTTT